MIRLAMICGLTLATTSFAAQDKKDLPKELVPFQGTWKVVKAEVGGMPLPNVPPEARFIFAGSKVTVKESKPKADEGSYTVDSKKDPAEIDLVSPKNEKILGIYNFEKDGKLTLAFIKDPKGLRPKKFDDKEAVVLTLELTKE